MMIVSSLKYPLYSLLAWTPQLIPIPGSCEPHLNMTAFINCSDDKEPVFRDVKRKSLCVPERGRVILMGREPKEI